MIIPDEKLKMTKIIASDSSNIWRGVNHKQGQPLTAGKPWCEEQDWDQCIALSVLGERMTNGNGGICISSSPHKYFALVHTNTSH